MSHYRRAHVNLLVAEVVDLEEHPDAPKFAQACIDLMALVKAQGFSDDPDYVERVTKHAEKVKAEIEIQLGDIKPSIARDRGERVELGEREAQIVKDLFEVNGLELADRDEDRLETMVMDAPAAESDDTRPRGDKGDSVMDQLENLCVEDNK